MRSWAGLSTLLCVVVAAATLAGPAAAAGPSVRSYHVEQRLRLDGGQGGSFTLACRRGDIATDGTWQVDQIDGAADLVSGVDVLEAAAFSAQGYRFTLRNTTQSAAHVQIGVACLDGTVGSGRDRHRLTLGKLRTTDAAVAPGMGSAPPVRCPSGAVAVGPGFRIDGSAGAVARVTVRTPAMRSIGLAQLGVVAIDPVTVTASARCLSLVTGDRTHRHRLRIAFRTAQTAVGDGRLETYTVACRRGESAIEGGYRLSEAWYVGQTQAGQRRTYRVQSPATGRAGTAQLGLLCLRDRAA